MRVRRLLMLAAILAPALIVPHASGQAPPPQTPPPARPQSPPTSVPVRPPSDQPPAYWKTRAEKSDYRITADYEETMRYCKLLESASRWVRVTSYGKSGQGRDLPLIIVSKDRAF